MSEDPDASRGELTARGRASRDRLVGAAMALMLERGVSATTIDEVLERAGASKSQMYHYFSGKRELVEAVIIRAQEMVLGAQQPQLDAIDSWAGLQRWADVLVAVSVEFGPELGCPLGTLAGELSASDDEYRHHLASAFATWQHMIRAGLVEMQSAGELERDADVERLAMVVLTSVQGGLLLAKTNRSTEPLRVALDSALAYVAAFRVHTS